ncbi:hypothetical protein KGM_213257 [Danaus plexippus plexippus]|uniref:Uncharacterized protein n=1 Tax=Danaus plexippus plexippus TaxID=278856 RepID=A0A212FE08_DANPL|nr:hypothetical protein KGM_213257 [Danaus plexippus plexippus]
MRYTRRPHQVYPEPVGEISNGSSNRKIGKYNLAIYNRRRPEKAVKSSITDITE